ncbi:MAG: di-trans,poly-cis-decaprenylcistransferase [Thermoplasmata archaeon]|nr:MAG: di-trans,poly-cis-decaprenylcistransferase [Thermoplasmata archaeon]
MYENPGGTEITFKNKSLKRFARKKFNKIGEIAIQSEIGNNLTFTIYNSKLSRFFREKINEFKNIKLVERIKKDYIPKHIAIIMDGNRRYAKQAGLKATKGHQIGKDKIEETLDWCLELGIKNLTVYAFSTENFKRSPDEIRELMYLCRTELDKAKSDSRIHKNKIKINVIGQLESLPKDIQQSAKELIEKTEMYEDNILTIALAYGGREEIIQAIKHIAEDVKTEKLKIKDINEGSVSSYLYTNGLPDPDLILRTSGEERISNFLLWQVAYSEFYFSDVYWPAFGKKDFLHAIETYQQRKRRFGK